PALSVDPKDYYVQTPEVKDPDGGTTKTSVDGAGVVVRIEKNWPDGDKTEVVVDTETNTARVTETPKGEPNLPSVT
ncbi:hypothetical protein, partial [Secundilactobacillus odoratitofui]|uniref:hypothetical protein n=1 Tax=Secundilactobacillus odoratitofui TaxID=480930 RepID=UPI00138F7673